MSSFFRTSCKGSCYQDPIIVCVKYASSGADEGIDMLLEENKFTSVLSIICRMQLTCYEMTSTMVCSESILRQIPFFLFICISPNNVIEIDWTMIGRIRNRLRLMYPRSSNLFVTSSLEISKSLCDCDSVPSSIANVVFKCFLRSGSSFHGSWYWNWYWTLFCL